MTKKFATRMQFVEAVPNNTTLFGQYREPEVFYDGPFKPVSQVLEEGMLEQTGIDYWLPGEVNQTKVYIKYYDYEEREV